MLYLILLYSQWNVIVGIAVHDTMAHCVAETFMQLVSVSGNVVIILVEDVDVCVVVYVAINVILSHGVLEPPLKL